jgi:hypothetical protein
MKMCRAEYGGRYDDVLGKDDAALASPGTLHTTYSKIPRCGVSLSIRGQTTTKLYCELLTSSFLQYAAKVEPSSQERKDRLRSLRSELLISTHRLRNVADEDRTTML